jgi:hypothetical protein
LKYQHLLVSATVVLSGCAGQTTWVNPNSDAQKFEADKAACLSEAISKIQYQPTVIAPAPQVPQYSGSTTNCSRVGNTLNCNTVANQNPYAALANQPQPNWVGIMQNNSQQTVHYEACMYSKGYSKSSNNLSWRAIPEPNPEGTLVSQQKTEHTYICVYGFPDGTKYERRNEAGCPPRLPD